MQLTRASNLLIGYATNQAVVPGTGEDISDPAGSHESRKELGGSLTLQSEGFGHGAFATELSCKPKGLAA
jgi:hypothetical protein